METNREPYPPEIQGRHHSLVEQCYRFKEHRLDYATRLTATRLTKSDSKPWTPKAFKRFCAETIRAIEEHGLEAVIDRIDEAIAKDWQGPNYDTIPKKHGQKTTRPSNRNAGTANETGRELRGTAPRPDGV